MKQIRIRNTALDYSTLNVKVNLFFLSELKRLGADQDYIEQGSLFGGKLIAYSCSMLIG